MRIGFDMLAVQSPHHGHRGIGRYSRHLVSALLAGEHGHDVFLYAHADLPTERIPSGPHAQLRPLGPANASDGLNPTRLVDRLARTNPDGLDVLVVLSPFELWSGYCPPTRPANGLKLAAVVYDMIPFLFPRSEVSDGSLSRHYRVLEDLKRYDALLAISEATRRDTLRLLGMAGDRVTNISAASDDAFFVPDPSDEPGPSSRAMLAELGINRPFVLNVGGFDDRKNLWRLIDAFALVPKTLRRRFQLVLTFTVLDSDRDRLLHYARAAGLDDALVVTGEVSDAALRVLYQRCTSFVFPSLYEGFGLPLLEAMHCGAAVLAGNNSSQPEVVGDAGLLANANDAVDIAANLARLLDDEPLRRWLRSRAVVQAGRFRWSESARLASRVLERLPGRQTVQALRRDPPHRRSERPRIAFFSPFPPRKSGISDYAVSLIDALKSSYTIDLYHDSGYVPEPSLADGALAGCDARLFPRQASVRNYHAIVYQMGNSRYHRFMYETMLQYPGVVTLHDFCLAGFHLDYGHWQGRERLFLRDELLRWYPDQARAIAEVLDTPPWDWDRIARACAERGWSLNRRILSCSQRVVVHSPWCLEQVRAVSDDDAARVTVIPLGSRARSLPTDDRRAEIRARFGLPRGALIVASFGFVNLDKLSPESLDAFRTLAQADPSALFVFAGEESDGGSARRHSQALGLSDRVRFLGRQPADAYADLIAVTDLGVNLRRPPTNGETSGALLDLLAAGIPTIVTDVATFADYPDAVVRKVRWHHDGPETLRRALLALAADPSARARLGDSARSYVRASHDWSLVAAQYADVIERCHHERVRAERRPGPGHGPRVASPTSAEGPSEAASATLRRVVSRRRRAGPRIAFFSPFPPMKSGISDYSALLLRELRQTYAIDLYHDSGYVPDLPDDDFACCDARLFARQASVRDYHAIVYQMGNSRYHHFMYEAMLRHPGVVTLHDFCLAGFHMHYGHRQGIERSYLRDELLRWYPDQVRAIAQVLDAPTWDREVIARECAERGWYLNRRIIARARRVVVHSPWCLEQVRKREPDDASRIVVIPHGIWPRTVSVEGRAAIRARFDIPNDALVVASFGFVHPDKMSPEALDAFGPLAQTDPSALFVFAGEEADGGTVRRHAQALGLSDRIRFLGHRPLSDFTDLIAATDIGVNLRRPPTHGETSGALLYLLASGVATLVTDVATFSDYPDTAVRKVKWETEGLAGLGRALRTLAADRPAREALGRAARDHVREHHEWSRVAKSYVDVIEQCHAEHVARPTINGPHVRGASRRAGLIW